MSSTISPSNVYDLALLAYRSRNATEDDLKQVLSSFLGGVIDSSSVRQLNAESGNLSPAVSGFGFVARGKGIRSNEVFVCTRGTQTREDISTDLNFLPTAHNQGGQVHRGFKKTFDSYAHNLHATVKQVAGGNKPVAVHCVGHSLGGALANLNAAALSSGRHHNVYLYTLAAPRVGLSAFGQFLDSHLEADRVFRVANLADPVTMLPCFPFMHAPIQRGHINLGSAYLAKVNPFTHMMGNGYKVIKGQSWDELKAGSGLMPLTRIVQKAKVNLEKKLTVLGRPVGEMMHSNQLLSAIGFLVQSLLGKQAYQSMITTTQWGTGAFTALDQLAETIYLVGLGTAQAADTARAIVSSIFHFIGQRIGQTIQITRVLLIQAFRMLQSVLVGMVKLALGKVGQ